MKEEEQLDEEYIEVGKDLQSQLEKRVNLDYQQARLIEFFINNHIYSYKIVEAESNYYKLSLIQRKKILQAHSLDVLCKSIILENTFFDPKYESEYYKQFYLTIVQYTNEFNAEKISKALKNLQNANCAEKLSKKFFHFRLAKNEVAYEMTGYYFNAITPYLMKSSNMKILFPKNLCSIYPNYFWVGGGEYELKVGMSIEDFMKLYGNRTFVIDLSAK